MNYFPPQAVIKHAAVSVKIGLLLFFFQLACIFVNINATIYQTHPHITSTLLKNLFSCHLCHRFTLCPNISNKESKFIYINGQTNQLSNWRTNSLVDIVRVRERIQNPLIVSKKVVFCAWFYSLALWSKIGKNTDKIAIQSFTVPRARE